MVGATTGRTGAFDRPASVADGPAIGTRFFAFYAAVVLVQGVHVVEHIIQLIQVYGSKSLTPGPRPAGLFPLISGYRGMAPYRLQRQLFGQSCCVAWGFWRSPVARSVVPLLAMAAFIFFGVWLEGWHVVEHIVIIANVIANNGCPCPGSWMRGWA